MLSVRGQEVLKAITAFQVGKRGWQGTTAYSSDSINKLMRNRQGKLVYRRQS